MVNFGLLAAEIVSLVWGTPAHFNGFRVVAALLHSHTAALNRRRHLYSAGRPSRWALAHISSFTKYCQLLGAGLGPHTLTRGIALDPNSPRPPFLPSRFKWPAAAYVNQYAILSMCCSAVAAPGNPSVGLLKPASFTVGISIALLPVISLRTFCSLYAFHFGFYIQSPLENLGKSGIAKWSWKHGQC